MEKLSKILQNQVMMKYGQVQTNTPGFKLIQLLVIFSVATFACVPNCLACTNSFCNICQNAYSLSNNCNSCQLNCQNCTVSYSSLFNTCVTQICEDGNCLVCSSYNNAICYECNSESSISKGSCFVNSTSSNNLTGVIIFIIASIVIALLLIFFIRKIYFCCLQRRLDSQRERALQARQKNARQSATMIYDKKDHLWKAFNDQDGFPYRQICSICLERSVNTKTPCNHTFHFNCLVQWVKRNDSCPQCRAPLNNVIQVCEKCHKKYIDRSVIGKESRVINKVCNSCIEHNKASNK